MAIIVSELVFNGAADGLNYQAGDVIDNDPVNLDLNNILTDLENHSFTLGELIYKSEQETDPWIESIDRTVAETIAYINSAVGGDGLLNVAVIANTTTVTDNDLVFPTSGAVYDAYIAHRDAIYQAVGDVRHAQTNIKQTGLGYTYTPTSLVTSPQSLLDEILNLRVMIDRIIGTTYWTDTPATTINTVNTDLNALEADFYDHSQEHIDGSDQLPSASGTTRGLMTSAQYTKLAGVATGANLYVHPTGDGNLHVPATGTTNQGKVLTATAVAGTYTWADINAQTRSIVAKTSNYTATVNDYTILCTASSANITISLPDAAAMVGKILVIKRMDATSYDIIIDPYGAQTIDGDATRTIYAQYEALTLQAMSTGWVII